MCSYKIVKQKMSERPIFGVHISIFSRMWSDSKVHELATVYLPWQQWTETSVWFYGVGISAFHSCVVDSWQSLSERLLLLSECVLVWHHKNVGASC
jgi:hypothetical protein